MASLDYYATLNSMAVFESDFTTGLLADIFKVFYSDQFIFSRNILYHFNGVYWKPDDDGLAILQTFVDTKFLSDLLAYANYKKKDDENEAKKYDKFITKAKTDLRTLRFRTSYVKDICRVLTNNEIKWNKNPYLYAFENIVFDLRTGKKIVPNPDDYLNTSCGYLYDENDDSNKVEELLQCLEKILVEKDLRDYFFIALSSGMCGLQISDIFICCGRGGNGKSLVLGLFKTMLGNYAYDAPVALLCQPLKMGGNPELFNMDGKRSVFGSEPDENSKLCSSTLKALTGNPTANARENFSNRCGIEFKMTLILDLNVKPKLDAVGGAEERRLENSIIPFNSMFLTQQKIDALIEHNGVRPTNVFLGDAKFVAEDFRQEYKQAFFTVLLPYFQRFMTERFSNVPDIVKKEGKDYLSQSDDIFDWFSENYEKDPSTIILISDLHKEFLRSSKMCYEMTKEEQRKYLSAKNFKAKLQSNIFLSCCYKERGSYWNKTQMKVPYLIGYKRLKEELDDPENTPSEN